MNTQISRRWFIGGLASFGALAGCRVVSGPAATLLKPTGKPNLRFGVVSDIHINVWDGVLMHQHTSQIFIKTLEWFRDQNVDAVVIAGDMADNGLIGQLEEVANCWFKVFPDDKAPDGHHVERVFIYGNHDMGGLPYTRWIKDKDINGKRKEVFTPENIIFTDPKATWEKVFHEEFTPMSHKVVKGYDFIGAQWLVRDCKGKDEVFNDRIPSFYDSISSKLNPHRPFFHIQHPHPKNTCFGPWVWGHDIGLSTKVLSGFPNAIALSGHSHNSLTDERCIWQGAFTSVGTASLRYISWPVNRTWKGKDVSSCFSCSNPDDQSVQQAMLWSVYDDCIVVNRHEAVPAFDISDDWLIPLPAAESKPFSFVEHAKKFRAPAFVENAKLEVQSSPNGLFLSIPATRLDKDARCFAFDVMIRQKQGDLFWSEQRIIARGYGRSEKDPKALTSTLYELKSLPEGEATIKVTPVSCFAKLGTPLTLTYKKA